jgi:hypothetical protein
MPNVTLHRRPRQQKTQEQSRDLLIRQINLLLKRAQRGIPLSANSIRNLAAVAAKVDDTNGSVAA